MIKLKNLLNESNDKGYDTARKLIDSLRKTTFRKFSDTELKSFIDTIADAFDLKRK